MLLPSRKTCRIVIAAKSVSLHLGQEVISKPYSVVIANPSQLMAELSELLLPFQPQLKAKKVDIILANAFVRYSVMLWRDGISKQKDWQAIAENHLRQLYGQKAANLHVEVLQQGYGKPLLVVSTDNTIVEQLDYLAKQQQWYLQKVEPAFVSVVNHFNGQLAKNTSVLLVEPQRLLLAYASEGCWQDFSVAMPVQGEETAEAKRLLSQAVSNHPIVFYGHDAVAKQLTEEGAVLERLTPPKLTDFKQNLGYGYLA